ncbi:MAG: TolB family protein [Roseiflexaceae bacterium]
MSLHRLTLALLVAFALIGCAPPAPGVPTTATPIAELPTAAPTQPPPATAVPTQPPPTTAPATPTPAPATAVPTAVPAQTPVDTATLRPTPASSELLFLRGGDLMAFEVATGKLRPLAPGVRDFAAGRDGATIALLRGAGVQSEVWTVRRDGSALTQVTHNSRAEASLAWAPDGAALAFSSSSSATPYAREWLAWSAWCVASEVHVLTLADQTETKLADGCDPAISPDGRRIAYAAPPTAPEAAADSSRRVVANSIRLINRQGQNGWDFAKAAGADAPAPNTGRLVYAPAWSPDGAQIVYQRFLGYQALVDLDISQIADSFKGGGEIVADGAGWLLPARFAPGGKTLAITENNYSDARGFGGYDNWSVSVIRLEGTREIALPSGTFIAIGQRVDQLPRGQAVAWSPDGQTLAVELPPGWRPDLPANEPLGIEEQPGELWLWTPGQPPTKKLVDGVDFASPLAWLP